MTGPFSRLPPSLKQRVRFLILGNLALLGYIWFCAIRTANSSFVDELSRFGSNVAPVLLAALGMTGIIATGAIDLSIGGIVVVAGSVFGILYEREANPSVCFAAC